MKSFQRLKVDNSWSGSWLLKFKYRNAPIRGLAIPKQNICEISYKKLCDKSIMIVKDSNYAMNALNKSSEFDIVVVAVR